MVTKSYSKTSPYINLALICISTLLTLALCEVVVRIFIPVRNVGPSLTIYDPVYGKRLKKNFTATRTTPEFTMQFTTNSLGFRGPEPEVFPYRPILFLGDSFTAGYGVNDGEEHRESPDAASKREHGHDGEHGRFQQASKGKPDIQAQVCDGLPPRLSSKPTGIDSSAFLDHQFRIAEPV